MLDYAKGLNDAMLGNSVTELSRQMIDNAKEELNQIIKETAGKGHRYLITKTETVIEDNKITIKTKYKGIPDIGGIAVKHFEEQGYIIYDLDKARECLKTL